MALTPEQKAAAMREEAANAARHQAEHAEALKALTNQKKNGALYVRLSAEQEEKTGIANSKVRVFRQCPVGANPLDYTLKTLKGMTYFRVQYMQNLDEDGKSSNGKSTHVLKITWSNHKTKGKDKAFQSTVFMNLSSGYQINKKAKKYLNPEEAKAIKVKFKQMSTFNPLVEGHVIDSNLFGFTTVQVEQGGTQTFAHNQAELYPYVDPHGRFRAALSIKVHDEEVVIHLHDLRGRKTKDGAERKHNAAKMVGYIPTMKSEETEKEEMIAILNRMKLKDLENVDIAEETTKRSNLANLTGDGEASEMGNDVASFDVEPVGCSTQEAVCANYTRNIGTDYFRAVETQSFILVDQQLSKNQRRVGTCRHFS